MRPWRWLGLAKAFRNSGFAWIKPIFDRFTRAAAGKSSRFISSRRGIVTFHTPETAFNHLDALRRGVEKGGRTPVHGLAPRRAFLPDTQTIQQFRRDRSDRKSVV